MKLYLCSFFLLFAFLFLSNTIYAGKRKTDAATNDLPVLQEEKHTVFPEDFYFDVDAISPKKDDENKFEIHGFFEITSPVKGRDDDSQQPSSEFLEENELVLWIGKQITKKLSFASEIEIEEGFNNYGLEKFEFSYHIATDVLQLRIGKFLYPFGIERFAEEGPFNKLVDRPLPSIRIIPGTYSDIGGMLCGTVPFLLNTRFKYEFAVTNGLEGPEPKDVQELWDNNSNKTLGGRIALECFPGIEVGSSYSRGKYDEDSKLDIDFLGADFQLKRGNWEIRGEYIASRVEQKAEDGGNYYRNGYYIQSAYRYPFNLDYLKYLEGVVRFDSVDPNRDITDGNEADRVAIGLNYSPMEHVVFKFEYEVENEPGEDIHGKSFVQAIFQW
ncbi:MAG: hypothetical protein E3K37_05795 [Candidatus Kuenenia sp.]|nr:hypothetical protein [Candidatus Kuenenia hertensis]